MSAVRARTLAWLATHEHGTVEKIARDITARSADVRAELLSLIDEGIAVMASDGDRPQSQRRVYRMAPVPEDGQGRPDDDLSGVLAALSGRPQPTHCDQILSLLVDGTTWSSHELHRRVFCILHSRIADLRKKLRPLGFDIEHTGHGAGTEENFYRLTRLAPLAAAPEPAHDLLGLDVGFDAAASDEEQLRLAEAA